MFLRSILLSIHSSPNYRLLWRCHRHGHRPDFLLHPDPRFQDGALVRVMVVMLQVRLGNLDLQTVVRIDWLAMTHSLVVARRHD